MGKWVIFDKWVITSILYVAVMIGGFTIYDEFIADDTKPASVQEHQYDENHGEEDGSSHEHGSHSQHEDHSEVITFVQSDENEIKIFFEG